MKECTKCKAKKPFDKFHKYKASKDGLKPICKDCDYECSRKNRLKRKFGITVDDYNKMLKSQDHKCGICGLTEDPIVRGRAFAVDHCHNNNEIRGLLCSRCNQALGHLGDNIQGIKKVLEYLENGHTGLFLSQKNLDEIEKNKKGKAEAFERYKAKTNKLKRR